MARPTTLPMFHPCFLLECFCLQLGLQACCQKPWRRACRKGRIDNHVLCIFFKCNPKRNSEGCYHYNFLFSSFAVAYHIPSMILPCFFFAGMAVLQRFKLCRGRQPEAGGCAWHILAFGHRSGRM